MLRRVTGRIIFAAKCLIFLEVTNSEVSLQSPKIKRKKQTTTNQPKKKHPKPQNKTTDHGQSEIPGKIVNVGDKLFYY